MQHSAANITSQFLFFFTHTTMGKGLQSNGQVLIAPVRLEPQNNATRSKKATVYLRAIVNPYTNILSCVRALIDFKVQTKLRSRKSFHVKRKYLCPPTVYYSLHVCNADDILVDKSINLD